jgi:hypothetical protein
MKKHWVLASLLGGIISFVWLVVSWLVMNWHEPTIHRFANQNKVAEAIRENATEDGIYLIPYFKPSKAIGEREEVKEIFEKGPKVFASIHVKPLKIGAWQFALSLINQIISAFLIFWLLSKTKGLNYLQGVGFITIAGLVASLLGMIPFWIWRHFAFDFIALCALDIIIGWFLAGLAMSKLALKN